MGTDLVFVPQAECLRLKDNPEAFAAACRINALSMIAMAGSGHIGSSFSAMDIVVWLHLKEMQDGDVFFSSKGHDCPALYSVLIGLGKLPEEMLFQLRKPGGLPGHPEVTTPGIACNTGSLGMGISKAKGMILADRLLGQKRRYFVMLGDGELQEGQIWESLRACADYQADYQMEELTVIIDANRLQSDGAIIESPESPSDRYLQFEAFNWGVRHIDGHDFNDIFCGLDWNSYGAPQVLIADTIKGRGVSFMENNPRWHSGAPNEEEYKAALEELMPRLVLTCIKTPGGVPDTITVPHTWPAPKQPDPLITAYSKALLELAEQDSRIVVLDADLAKDHGLFAFKERFPERYFECGIAEQDMVSTASGLALRGFIPVCHSFAAFLTRRALDQIYNQCTEGTKVIYVGSMAGPLPPTGPGPSHESVADDILMDFMPGMMVYEPNKADLAARALERAVNGCKGSAYIRLLHSSNITPQ